MPYWMRNWHARLTHLLPLPAATEFVSHTGVPWRVCWWQWRGRIWHKRGQPIGPRNPALASPCACHDADGKRTRREGVAEGGR